MREACEDVALMKSSPCWLMDLSAAFQTPQTGDLCIVKDIIQQDSRDHEFVDPEAKKAANATAWHSGVTYFSDVFTYLIFLRAYNQEWELDGFSTSFVSNTKPRFSWSCSPRSHRASEMLVLSPQHLGAKSNVYFGHSRELINFIITDNYFSSFFFESSSWPRPKPTRLRRKEILFIWNC